MASSEREELNQIIQQVFEGEFGMRASHAEVAAEVIDRLPSHLARYYAEAGVRNQVSAYFKRRNAHGLPSAPVADKKGTHVQLELMNVAELAYVASRYIDKAEGNLTQARKVGKFVSETFHRDLVVDGINLSAEAKVA